MGQLHIVKEIFNLGEQIIDNGGKIFIQREYTNAPAEILAVFESLDALKNWEERLKLIK